MEELDEQIDILIKTLLAEQESLKTILKKLNQPPESRRRGDFTGVSYRSVR